MLPAKGFGATLSTADIVTPFTDYSRWERKPCRITLASKRRDSSEVIPPVCHHGHSYVRKKPPGRHIPPQASPQGKPPGKILAKKPTRPIARNLDPPNVRLLKLQIATRGSSITEYQQHQEELLSRNLSLISSIEQVEEKTHATVKELFEKYQKFKGALSSLQQRSAWEVEERQAELQVTRERLHKEINELRGKVSQTEATLHAKSRELRVLQHYKDKEYPVKLVRIEQLREQINILTEQNKAALSELESHIFEEHERCEQQLEAIRMRLEAQATEASIARMQRSIQEKAIQNKIMEKEILIHKQRCDDLEESIRNLKSEISHLRHTLKVHACKRQPLMALGKCLPSTEVRLNIPLQEHLPV